MMMMQPSDHSPLQNKMRGTAAQKAGRNRD